MLVILDVVSASSIHIPIKNSPSNLTVSSPSRLAYIMRNSLILGEVYVSDFHASDWNGLVALTWHVGSNQTANNNF